MGDCALMAVVGVASEMLAVQVELPILPIFAGQTGMSGPPVAEMADLCGWVGGMTGCGGE
jgi:hypothetical protein